MKQGEYIIKVSNRRNKKYDVYKNGSYMVSFCDKRYQHYHDKFKNYSNLDHNDEKRRKAYRARHKNDRINDPDYAGYWAYNFLW